MVVILMEKVPVSLRGEITRWMIELRPGVFVGTISALVREKLWEHICQKTKGGAVTMLLNAANEQGYTIRTHGETTRKIRNFDGLQLVTVPARSSTRNVEAVGKSLKGTDLIASGASRRSSVFKAGVPERDE